MAASSNSSLSGSSVSSGKFRQRCLPSFHFLPVRSSPSRPPRAPPRCPPLFSPIPLWGRWGSARTPLQPFPPCFCVGSRRGVSATPSAGHGESPPAPTGTFWGAVGGRGTFGDRLARLHSPRAQRAPRRALPLGLPLAGGRGTQGVSNHFKIPATGSRLKTNSVTS